MCGIIGILGDKDAAPQLLEGLKRLEYRGYDSAGIATLVEGSIHRRRAEGKLINLEKERSIDVIITRLRKKIEMNPKNPKYLQTIRGTGYVLWIE